MQQPKRIQFLSISLTLPVLIGLLLLAAFKASPNGIIQAAPNATVTVTILEDEADGDCTDGDCSLRDAIATANDGDTIDFNLEGTIVLSSTPHFLGELAISKGLTIDGGDVITISGNNAVRVFNVMTSTLSLNVAVIFASLRIISGSVTTNDCGVLSDLCGGGIMLQSSGVAVTLTNSTLSGNEANYRGGGIYNYEGQLTVSNSTLSDNSSDNDGGGIYNHRGTLIIHNSTLTDNEAKNNGGGNGGGIFNNDGMATVSNSTLSGNEADFGGGIYNISSTLTISNSTLSGNWAYNGGGIYNNDSGMTTVSNSTLSGNNAFHNGGGIRNLGTVTVNNSMIANSPNGDDCFGTMISEGDNLDSDGSCSFNISGVNPLLGPLTDNGGPATSLGQATMTHALLPGSPAIDAGDCSAGPATDQRGMPRPIGVACDIGAFEGNAFLLAVNSVGSGSVTKSPVQASYEAGMVVTVTAVPDIGWSFASWNGDLSGSTNPESVTISGNMVVTATFSNDAPMADAGSDQTVSPGQMVTLDGSASSDDDPSQTLSYSWLQTGGPTVVLSDKTAVSPTFTALDSKTTLTFALTVTDSLGLPSSPSEVVVTVDSYRVFLPMIVTLGD